MKMFDIHRHLWDTDWFPPQHRMEFAIRAAKNRRPERDPESILPRVGKGVYDPDGTKMIGEMDDLGIDASAIMVMDWGMAYVTRGYADSPLPIEQINEKILSLRDKYPGRVYGFCSVDPRRHGAVKLIKKAITEWGAVGVKIYPPCGYYANDPMVYPIYQVASDLGVPVLIHTGGSMFSLLTKWAVPEPVEDVALAFPDLQIILGHTNLQARFETGNFWRGIQVAASSLNIHCDLTDWQVHGALDERNIGELIHVLGIMRRQVGAHRMIWGTDLPIQGTGYESTRAWTNLFRNLPEEAAKYGVTFTQEEAELICHGNAERLLQLGTAS